MTDDAIEPDLPTDATANEPVGTDGVVDDPQAEPEQTSPPDADPPGIDDFLDNSRRLLRRSDEVLPFVWIAIVMVLMVPSMTKIMQGYDPMQTLQLEIDVWLLATEMLAHLGAVVLLTLSMPLARAYLLEDEGPQTIGGGLEMMARYFPAALALSALYYMIVFAGLLMCIIPGLLAAALLLPALYMGAVRDESVLRAFLKAPGQLGDHSRLFAPVYVGFIAVLFGVSLALGTAIQTAGGVDEILAHGLVAILGFSLAFIAVTAVAYLLYIGLLAVFVTIEAYDTGAEIR